MNVYCLVARKVYLPENGVYSRPNLKTNACLHKAKLEKAKTQNVRN